MPPSHSPKQKAERRGRRGELLAALYLCARFYRIRAMRVKTPVGEIDLVAERGDVTVFVEVKTRRRGESAADALMAVNQRRITRAAEYYLTRHPNLTRRTLRFDVIFVAPFAWPRHIANAFPAH
jgi:putative endonuclease